PAALAARGPRRPGARPALAGVPGPRRRQEPVEPARVGDEAAGGGAGRRPAPGAGEGPGEQRALARRGGGVGGLDRGDAARLRDRLPPRPPRPAAAPDRQGPRERPAPLVRSQGPAADGAAAGAVGLRRVPRRPRTRAASTAPAASAPVAPTVAVRPGARRAPSVEDAVSREEVTRWPCGSSRPGRPSRSSVPASWASTTPTSSRWRRARTPVCRPARCRPSRAGSACLTGTTAPRPTPRTARSTAAGPTPG